MSGREHDIAFYDLMIKTSEAIDNKLDTVTGTPGELAAWGSNNDIVSSGIVPGSCAFIDMTMGENEDADHDLAPDEVYFRSKAKLERPGGRPVTGGWSVGDVDYRNGNPDVLIGTSLGYALYRDSPGYYRAAAAGDPKFPSDIVNDNDATPQLYPYSIGQHRSFVLNNYSQNTQLIELREYPNQTVHHLKINQPIDSGNSIYNPAMSNRSSWFIYKSVLEVLGNPQPGFCVYEVVNATRGPYGTRYTIYVGPDDATVPTFYLLSAFLTIKYPDGEIYAIETDRLKVVDEYMGLSPAFYTLPDPVEGEEGPRVPDVANVRLGTLLSDASSAESVCRFHEGVYGFADKAGGWSLLNSNTGATAREPTAQGLYWAERVPMLGRRSGQSIQIWPINGTHDGFKQGLELPNVHLVKQTSKGLFLFEKQEGGLPAGGDYMTAVAATRGEVSIHSYGQSGLYFGTDKSYAPFTKGYGVQHLHDSIPFIKRAGPLGFTIEAMQHPKLETIAFIEGNNVQVDGFIQGLINGNPDKYEMTTSFKSQVCVGNWPSWMDIG